jgi:hypothetical protein
MRGLNHATDGVYGVALSGYYGVECCNELVLTPLFGAIVSPFGGAKSFSWEAILADSGFYENEGDDDDDDEDDE